ncbi:hypothetical protein F5B20DRAFT_430837 [Whalleya microplaca]|nr:hypothetical protein F5B20DRAFT_430837 [Whalleya microplaca]
MGDRYYTCDGVCLTLSSSPTRKSQLHCQDAIVQHQVLGLQPTPFGHLGGPHQGFQRVHLDAPLRPRRARVAQNARHLPADGKYPGPASPRCATPPAACFQHDFPTYQWTRAPGLVSPSSIPTYNAASVVSYREMGDCALLPLQGICPVGTSGSRCGMGLSLAGLAAGGLCMPSWNLLLPGVGTRQLVLRLWAVLITCIRQGQDHRHYFCREAHQLGAKLATRTLLQCLG